MTHFSTPYQDLPKINNRSINKTLYEFCKQIVLHGETPSVVELEKLLLEMADESIRPADALTALLESPSVEGGQRLDLFLDKMDDDKYKKFQEDYYGYGRFIPAAVAEALNEPILLPKAEKICLNACKHESRKMQENGIKGLEEIYAPVPKLLLATYQGILDESDSYQWLAKTLAAESAAKLGRRYPEHAEQVKKISLTAMMAKGDAANVNHQGLENMERSILGIAEDDYMERYHLVDLSAHDQKTKQNLALFYYHVVGAKDLYPDFIRRRCLERSTDIVKQDQSLAPIFEPMFIKSSVDLSLGYKQQTLGFEGLKAINFDFDNKKREFKSIAAEISEPIYLEATMLMLDEQIDLLKGNEVGFFCKKIRKKCEALKSTYDKNQKEVLKNQPSNADLAMKQLNKFGL